MNSRLPLILLAGAIAALAALFVVRQMNPAAPPGKLAANLAGNLAGASIGGPFTLVDEAGRTVTSASYTGRYRLMYFGYTFCPDVCPVDTANLAAGLKAYEAAQPERAARVQPLFVTVDPARDTPAVLRAFTAAFHPRLVGLSGSAAQVAAALRTFRVAAQRTDGATPGSYLMNHAAVVYLFGPAGAPIAFIAGPEADPAAITAMLDTYVR
jgi:protein SCO1